LHFELPRAAVILTGRARESLHTQAVRALVAITCLLTAQPSPPVAFSFHHVHLNQGHAPTDLIAFYERLFDRRTTVRESVGGADALRSGRTLLLVSRMPLAGETPTALWHFGWGNVSLTETYLAHARQEVAWEPPLPADRLHLHLRSVIPAAAAAWYADTLGAEIHVADAAPLQGTPLPPPEHRLPEAIAWIGDTALLFYRFDPPLASTRGQRVDHIALATDDVDAAVASIRRRGVTVLAAPAAAGGLRSATIEGPDRMAIEIVEARDERE
jgi:hypothetical protein